MQLLGLCAMRPYILQGLSHFISTREVLTPPSLLSGELLTPLIVNHIGDILTFDWDLLHHITVKVILSLQTVTVPFN